jgi:hypothetical protein
MQIDNVNEKNESSNVYIQFTFYLNHNFIHFKQQQKKSHSFSNSVENLKKKIKNRQTDFFNGRFFRNETTIAKKKLKPDPI